MNSFTSKEAAAGRLPAAAGAGAGASAGVDGCGGSPVAFPCHVAPGQRFSLSNVSTETFFSTPVTAASPAPTATAAACGAAVSSGADEAFVCAAKAAHPASTPPVIPDAAATAYARTASHSSGVASSSPVGTTAVAASGSARLAAGGAALPSTGAAAAAAHGSCRGCSSAGKASHSSSSSPTPVAGRVSSPKRSRSSRRGYFIHKVQPADTLLSIALQYDVPVPYLMLANKLSSSDIWFVDTVIIPCKKSPQTLNTSSSRSPPSSSNFSVASLPGPPSPSTSPSPPCLPGTAPAALTTPTSTTPLASAQRQQHQKQLPGALPPASSSATKCRPPRAIAAAAADASAAARLPRFVSAASASAAAASSSAPTDTAAAVLSQGQDRSSKGDTAAPPAGGVDVRQGVSAIPESVHESAHIAMLVNALVRQEGVDAKLARAQVTHWNLYAEEKLEAYTSTSEGAIVVQQTPALGDFHAAALDCREIRHWQQALGVSVQEILAYLSMYDYDVDKARTAMVEDVRWHQAHADRQEQLSRGGPSRNWFSFSFFSQLFSPVPSSARYTRIPDHRGIAAAEEGSISSSISHYAEPPRIVGLPSSFSRSSTAALSSTSFPSSSPTERLPPRPVRSAAFSSSSPSRCASSLRVRGSTPPSASSDCSGAAATAAGLAGGIKEEALQEERRRRSSRHPRRDGSRPARPRPLDLEMSRL